MMIFASDSEHLPSSSYENDATINQPWLAVAMTQGMGDPENVQIESRNRKHQICPVEKKKIMSPRSTGTHSSIPTPAEILDVS